jgi:hypothetical protein
MSLGVHFALLEKDARRLQRAKDDDALQEVLEEIEERWDKRWLQETDKAWDAIHRCLTDGYLYSGSTPLHRVIYAETNLSFAFDEEDDYFASLLTPRRVQGVADAIRGITKAWMRARYFALPADDYDGHIDEDDFDYTWGWFVALRRFYQRAAKAGRWVSFTVSY